MCGAANCSGLIGEKPNKEEKKVKEDKNKKVAVKNNKSKMKTKKKKKKKNKAVKSKSPTPAPLLMPVSTSPVPVLPRQEAKIWEEFCYRCGEEGNLLRCDRALCPKVVIVIITIITIITMIIPRPITRCVWARRRGRLASGCVRGTCALLVTVGPETRLVLLC